MEVFNPNKIYLIDQIDLNKETLLLTQLEFNLFCLKYFIYLIYTQNLPCFL